MASCKRIVGNMEFGFVVLLWMQLINNWSRIMLDFWSLRILVMEVVMDDWPDPGTPVSQDSLRQLSCVSIDQLTILSMISTLVSRSQPVLP